MDGISKWDLGTIENAIMRFRMDTRDEGILSFVFSCGAAAVLNKLNEGEIPDTGKMTDWLKFAYQFSTLMYVDNEKDNEYERV